MKLDGVFEWRLLFDGDANGVTNLNAWNELDRVAVGWWWGDEGLSLRLLKLLRLLLTLQLLLFLLESLTSALFLQVLFELLVFLLSELILQLLMTSNNFLLLSLTCDKNTNLLFESALVFFESSDDLLIGFGYGRVVGD